MKALFRVGRGGRGFAGGRIRTWTVRLAVLLLAVFLAFTGARYYAYRRLLGYSPAQDYRATFGTGISLTVAVDRAGFTFPEVDRPWDTALLKLRLVSSLSGYMAEPTVATDFRSVSFKQYVERGTRGVRYLNLSPIATARPAAGDRVTLTGRRVSWRPQQAELRLFGTLDPDTSTILVLAPHPDDAEIAAFGLYGHGDAFVITVTAGDAGSNDFGMFAGGQTDAYRIKGRLRAWDSVTVPLWGNVPVSRTANMGYPDGQLRAMLARTPGPVGTLASGVSDVSFFRRYNQSNLLPREPRKATWPNLVADVALLLGKIKPDIVVVPHPALDTHPDHVCTTIALCQALRRVAADDGHILLYSTHHVVSRYHPCGGLDGIVSFPVWFTDSPRFTSAYSHPLTPGEQVDKILALDMMHGLRSPFRTSSPPPGVPTEGGDPLEGLARFTEGDTHSYFRRATRPNEFFVVEPFSRAAELEAMGIAALGN